MFTDSQIRSTDRFLHDALETLLTGERPALAAETVAFAMGVFTLPVVLGRLSRFLAHVDGVSCSLLHALDREAVVETATGWAEALRPGSGPTVLALHPTLADQQPLRWPEDDDAPANLELAVGGLVLVAAAVALLASVTGSDAGVLLDELWP